ncbi:dnaJ homolog subfamily B member 13 isoform X2 [Thalassophryne amazonica]|uniref:dnaJ homolog subfamily B member 13 isoform X2 n=1 Tax=Thalassophryne amazonica TaxID=390379 RepID=UPI001471DB69|nr:dnaJ homolog subfamily B member 13 isoform X2 [Thalassophryne amazonica]
MGGDYYETLDINRGATDADIKKAYRRLALKFHPSRNTEAGSTERFNQLGEAYEVLSDPQKRATYDKFGEEGLKDGIPLDFAKSGAWSSGYVYHGNPYKTFRKFFGGDNPFADFYTSEAPLQFGGLQPEVQKRQDSPIERDLHLSLDDIFHGCTKKISISLRGSNNIPADIVFIMRQKPHPYFTRDHNNLIYKAKISLKMALTGFSVDVKTLDGRLLSIPINDIVHPTYTKVVTGEGMPHSQDPSHRGNLIITFDIQFPDKLDVERRHLIKQALSFQ